ncbi:MAG TPA: helix-turn-helix domain-containing protein, partial [Marmoricola sp.]
MAVVPFRRTDVLRPQPGREVRAGVAGLRRDARRLSSSDANRHLSLHEAADLLGVHYMTVYRRVRLGILPARKVGGTWMIDRADLERSGTARRRGRRRRADGEPETGIWRERLRARMLVGDVVGSWRVIEAAMA